MQINVGVDGDGVLNYKSKFQFDKGVPYFQELYNKKDVIVNPVGYDIKDVFKCNEKDWYEFWKKNIFNYCLATSIRENAPEVIQQLQNEGKRIDIITGRQYSSQCNAYGILFRAMFEYWIRYGPVDEKEVPKTVVKSVYEYLNKIYKKPHNDIIKPDSITYTKSDPCDIDKLLSCILRNTAVMIDDNPPNINLLSKWLKVLCIDEVYNKDCKGKNITRVSGFEDVYKYIDSNSYELTAMTEERIFNLEGIYEYIKPHGEEYINKFEKVKGIYLLKRKQAREKQKGLYINNSIWSKSSI